MASTDVMLSSPVASDGFKTKFLASPEVAVVQAVPADASSSKRQQVKLDLISSAAVKFVTKQQQLKPRFTLELDGLNCFETLVPR